MKLILLIALLGLFTSKLSAAVVLASFDGTQYPTANNAWTMTSATTVSATLVEEAGRKALRLSDVGTGSGSNNFLNINKPLSAPEVTNLFNNGWEYRFTFKMGDENTEAWTADSNTFATMTWYDSAAATRKFHTLLFGRTSTGQTLVTVSSSNTDVKTLAAGFHDYAMIYRPGTQTTELWIDGEFWKNMTASNTTGTASYISWGDNSNQATIRNPARVSYFTDVSLVMTPEPSVSVLLMISAGAFLFRRRRA